MVQYRRREFSIETRRLAWTRANGACEGRVPQHDPKAPYDYLRPFRRCNAPVDIGCFVYEHLNPAWMSDDASLENCAVYCLRCAKVKTKLDVQNIAKAKRIIAKRTKTKKPRGRPLPGTKRSGWKKSVGGKVERR